MNINKTLALSALAICVASCTSVKEAPGVVIDIDAKNVGPDVSNTHYGIFFEDINHAADGGLYAELINNRSFEDDAWYGNHHGVTAWKPQGGAKMQITTNNLLNNKQHHALKVTLASPGDGIANTGFWGINAVKDRPYRLSFWVRSDKGYKGKLTARLQSADGTVLGSTDIDADINGKWKKLTAKFTATGNDPKAEFALVANNACEFMIDVVSLFPPTFKNRENGMRPELAQMLADMKPRFMRFPGGCHVEGDSPENAYRWERTIGPIEEREGHPNSTWGYRTTDGIGFHEYLQLAEDLGAEPLYVVNVGIWHGGSTPYNQIDGWIKECMDALEYANGDITTKYGKKRAEAGHPEPFNLKYVEIGNENYNYVLDRLGDNSDHYPERYIQFYKAIKAKYPDMKIIGNVEAWSTDTPSWRNEHPVDMVDEHYYRTPRWFAERFHKYDTYARNTHKVYVGEYAVTSQFGVIGNLNAALGEAVFMMGMENNADVVVMNSYAPIFVNENDARWRPDMIRFNSAKVMGTPSYYVQKLFPNNIGTKVIKTNCQFTLTPPENAVAEEEKPSQVGVGTWSTQAEFRNPQLVIEGKTIDLSDYSKWQNVSGQWSISDEGMKQSEYHQPAIMLAPEVFNATKYIYKVQARKLSGDEGFLIITGYKGENTYCWFNMGGWGNTQNCVEQNNRGEKVSIAESKPYVVEKNQWYDIEVHVDGKSIEYFINGEKAITATTRAYKPMEGVFASTTLDEENNVMYVKVVNVGDGHAAGRINLANCTAIEGKATLTRLSSGSGEDENTLDNPDNIVPQEGEVEVSSPTTVDFDVPAFSVNIIRIEIEK